jgi:hypothetical protein
MFPDIDTLEKTLERYCYWRDFGNIVLLVGVRIETAIDRFWPESIHPPLFRGQRATTLIRGRLERTKKPLAFIVGLIVVAGIGIEWVAGNMADDQADEIRTNLEKN